MADRGNPQSDDKDETGDEKQRCRCPIDHDVLPLSVSSSDIRRPSEDEHEPEKRPENFGIPSSLVGLLRPSGANHRDQCETQRDTHGASYTTACDIRRLGKHDNDCHYTEENSDSHHYDAIVNVWNRESYHDEQSCYES